MDFRYLRMRVSSRLATRACVFLLFSAVFSAFSPPAAHAQHNLGRDIEEAVEWFLGFPSWTIEAYGGLANHGRFLLQTVGILNEVIVFPLELDEIIFVQRELTAKNAFSFGGAAGFTILPKTTIRLAFNHASSDLEYKNDTGLGVVRIEDDTGLGFIRVEDDDVGDLGSNTVSLEVLRYFLPERIKFSPYAGLGVALTWWHLGDEDPDFFITGGDDTQTRWGGVGTLGVQYRWSDAWALRAEAATYSIGNPFNGDESFVTTSGFTIDEPTRVRQTNFRLVVSYTFGRPDRPEFMDGH